MSTPDTPCRAVHVTRSSEISTSDGQTRGMTRQGAIVSLSPHLCGNLMRAAPRSSSDVHHHGGQDTIVYAVSGTGVINGIPGTLNAELNDVCELMFFDPGSKRQCLSPGDWAIIPAYAEHQEANEGEEEVVWVIVRGPGGTPVVENLGGWGESAKSQGEGWVGRGEVGGEVGRKREV